MCSELPAILAFKYDCAIAGFSGLDERDTVRVNHWDEEDLRLLEQL